MAQNYVAPGRDLSEYFRSEFVIRKGHVVELGGPYEVQVCDTANSTAVAGVVTEDSALVMNSETQDFKPRTLVAIAGRVMCHVYGPCSKGDMLVTKGGGYAAVIDPDYPPENGAIFARAMEDKVTTTGGLIEVLLGRG